ncbi:MAG: hypothetical protein ACRC37_06215 [Lentisphaeria bacterium]
MKNIILNKFYIIYYLVTILLIIGGIGIYAWGESKESEFAKIDAQNRLEQSNYREMMVKIYAKMANCSKVDDLSGFLLRSDNIDKNLRQQVNDVFSEFGEIDLVVDRVITGGKDLENYLEADLVVKNDFLKVQFFLRKLIAWERLLGISSINMTGTEDDALVRLAIRARFIIKEEE